MVRTKVFVGNLSFKTTDKDLSKEFEVAGKVATANIITRGSRSLGYGFVEMESEEEAKKSVELLNKKTIDGREINVEVARPREDRPAAPAGEGSPAPAGDATGSPSARGRGRRGGNRRTGGAAGSPATTPAAGDAAAPSAAAPAPKKPRAPRTNKKAATGENKTGVEVGTAGDAATGSPSAATTRRPRAARPPRDDSARPASKTTLFVANLPFTVDDAQLTELFKGFNIKAAHVVRKPNNNAKSKGFGFVEFNTEEDQLKALEAVNKKLVGERELSVKVALAEVPRATTETDAATPAAGLPAVPPPGVAATAESK